MKVKLLRDATQDILDGVNFYNKQAKDLGAYFLRIIFSDIDSLAERAGHHPKYFGSFHRKLVRRFPFAIYYEFEHDTVVVHAVLDCRRSPAWIRERLEN